MKLNLGCGDDRREGYVNVDFRSDVADCLADVRKLPFDNASCSEILAFDVLEHLPRRDTVPTLQEWHRVLEPGGLLRLRVPNLYQIPRALVAAYEARRDDFVDLLIENIYGGHRWGPDGAWDAHHTGWTERSLGVVLAEAGFAMIGSDGGMNMEVEARAV